MPSHRGNLNLILIDDPLLLFSEGAVFSLMNTVNFFLLNVSGSLKQSIFTKGLDADGGTGDNAICKQALTALAFVRPFLTESRLLTDTDVVYHCACVFLLSAEVAA